MYCINWLKTPCSCPCQKFVKFIINRKFCHRPRVNFVPNSELIYSSRNPDVLDSTVKRNIRGDYRQAQLEISVEKENTSWNRNELDCNENSAVCISHIYPHVAKANIATGDTVSGSRIIPSTENDGIHDDTVVSDSNNPIVYPFALNTLRPCRGINNEVHDRLNCGRGRQSDYYGMFSRGFDVEKNRKSSSSKSDVSGGRRRSKRISSNQRRRNDTYDDGRGRNLPMYEYIGQSEHNDDFKGGEKSMSQHLAEDELYRFGTANPLIKMSRVPCGSCGALLHCKDPKMAGFCPSEDFMGKTEDQLRSTACQRCYVMKKYRIALKMTVPPSIYESTMNTIREKGANDINSKRSAVVVLVVDLTDFPSSVMPNILDILGSDTRIILCGNKVDMFIPESVNYLTRLETSMRLNFLNKCNNGKIRHDPKNVESVLVSARTGYNIETLISKIFNVWDDSTTVRRHSPLNPIPKASSWFHNSDLYVVGTTNVGKSSIFNALLDSDLCKIKAIDCVEKAMTSPLPGTTLNLLKFPVVRPDPEKFSKRVSRLNRIKSIYEERHAKAIRDMKSQPLRKRGGIVTSSLLDQPIIRTTTFDDFEHRMKLNTKLQYGWNEDVNQEEDCNDENLLKSLEEESRLKMRGEERLVGLNKRDKLMPFVGGVSFDLDVARKPEYSSFTLPRRLDPTFKDFADGKWCYDTPGALCHDQILNLLTQEEASFVTSEVPIIPQTFTVRNGTSLFIGGLARLDLVSSSNRLQGLLISVFCSHKLPINMVRTESADSFYSQSLGTPLFQVPKPSSSNLSDDRRLKDFPKLQGKEITIDGVGNLEVTCDIVLSSVGFISVIPEKIGEKVTLRAWTPNGKGIYVRDPPFLPFIHYQRGHRISGTPAHMNDGVDLIDL